MKKLIIIFTLIFFSNSNAEIARNVIIEGNKRISDETIKVYGNIKLNTDVSKQDINQILKDLYSTEFFENIEISLNDGVLKIVLKEYQIINNIELRGEKTEKFKELILERISLRSKGSFVKSKLVNDVNLIKKIYGTLGYSFAKVETKLQSDSDERINLVFLIDKGNKTKISKIFFIGDKKIKDRRLRDVIVSEEDKFWKFLTKNVNYNQQSIDLDKRLLSNYYKSMGYYDVQVVSSSVDIENQEKVNITYNINAGPRYKIKKITTDIGDVIDKKLFLPLKKEFNKRIGKYYSPFSVKKLLDEIDAVISNNDLQFIQHSVNEVISEADETIEIQFNVFEGPKLAVERINIKGNTVTNEAVVRSELMLDEGDPFNELKLDQSISKLKARGIFGAVKKVVTTGSDSELKIIDIIVEEKATGEISAGAGVGTQGGSFAFDVKENNWLGQGVSIASFIDVNAETLKGQLQVSNPNFNYSGNALTYLVSSTQNDKPDSGYENSLVSLAIGTGFEQYRGIYVSPELSLDFDDLTVDGSASENLKKQAGNFTDFSLNYAVSADRRDRAFMPTDGYYSSFSQALPVYSDSPSIRNTYMFSKYQGFSENLVGAFKFYASAIHGMSSDDVRLSKRISLPFRRLRGFEAGKVGPVDNKDYIGGNYATAMNFEANLPNLFPESSKTEMSLFLDAANLWGVDYSSTIEDSNKIRSSAGSVVNWTSPIGPMSLVFAQEISSASTDKTESFRFRIGTSF